MRLARRVQYYLVGVVLGIGILFTLHGDRGCKWLPNERLIDFIVECDVRISERIECQTACNKWTTEDLYLILDGGQVDFGSRTESGGMEKYWIAKEGISAQFQIDKEDSTVTIVAVGDTLKGCDCASKTNNEFTLLDEPMLMILKKLRGKEIYLSSKLSCYLSCYHLDEQKFKTNVLSESWVKKAVKGLNNSYELELDINGETFTSQVDQSTYSTRIRSLTKLAADCDCP